jgi:hypothetical protein
MIEDRSAKPLRDVTSSYRSEPEILDAESRAWIEKAIDEGLASPPILDRTVQEVMAEIRTKNRAVYG